MFIRHRTKKHKNGRTYTQSSFEWRWRENGKIISKTVTIRKGPLCCPTHMLPTPKEAGLILMSHLLGSNLLLVPALPVMIAYSLINGRRSEVGEDGLTRSTVSARSYEAQKEYLVAKELARWAERLANPTPKAAPNHPMPPEWASVMAKANTADLDAMLDKATQNEMGIDETRHANWSANQRAQRDEDEAAYEASRGSAPSSQSDSQAGGRSGQASDEGEGGGR